MTASPALPSNPGAAAPASPQPVRRTDRARLRRQPLPVVPPGEPSPWTGLLPRDEYAFVIDARSPREFAEDHVPGAVNLPVVDDPQYAEVGTLHRTDTHGAYLIGVAHSLRNMADHIDRVLRHCRREDRLLVYCFRGGKRSRLWAENLRIIGFRVDVLPGGWKQYRRWVLAELARLPPQFSFRVLTGPTGCGKTRLLAAMAEEGAQVLDLEAIAAHRGSLIGALPHCAQPSQKYFDSLLLERLQALDPSRPVWVEAESKRIGQVQLPDALHAAIHTAPIVAIDMPMAQRVQLWRTDYAHWVTDPEAMVARLLSLRALLGAQELALWQELAQQRQVDVLFERVMTAHYDPAYQRTTLRHFPELAQAPRIAIARFDAQALRQAAHALMALPASAWVAPVMAAPGDADGAAAMQAPDTPATGTGPAPAS